MKEQEQKAMLLLESFDTQIENFGFRSLADFYAIVGRLYHYIFNRTGEKEFLEKAVEFFELALAETEESELIGLARLSLGEALFQQGNYTRATETLEIARREWQERQDYFYLAITLFDLARLYHLQSFLEQARLYYKDSLRLFRRVGDHKREAATMVALGNLLMQTGRISESEEYLRKAKKYYEENNNLARLQEIQKILNFIPKDYAGFTKI